MSRHKMYVVVLVVLAFALMTWRRAHTISVQFGHDMWSRAMWHELGRQVIVAAALVLIVGFVYWLREKDGI